MKTITQKDLTIDIKVSDTPGIVILVIDGEAFALTHETASKVGFALEQAADEALTTEINTRHK